MESWEVLSSKCSPNNAKRLVGENGKMTGNYQSLAVICSPATPYVFNLNNKPSCQTLSNTLEMSKKIPLTWTAGLIAVNSRLYFHVLWIVVGQCMSLLKENLIGKA